MGKFGIALVNGYKKSEVDEYVSFLLEELHAMKEHANVEIQSKNQKLKELETQLAKEKEECSELQKELLETKEKIKKEYCERIVELEAKLNRYEGGYESVSQIFSIAEERAKSVVDSAKVDAHGILVKAKNEADIQRREAEDEIEEKREKYEKVFKVAGTKVNEYLQSFYQSQNTLIKTYHELGILVDNMPIQMESLFAEKQLELSEEIKSEEKPEEKQE